MKKLSNSIVLQGVQLGLNSLNKRDYKFKKDEGVYHCSVVIPKKSQEFNGLYGYIKEVLSKKNLIPKDIKSDKMPIKDGDKIFAGLKQDTEKIKGEWLKGNYTVKILTNRDYKVFDEIGQELDKKDVAFTGAKVNIHCTPYYYENDYGKGIQILLHAINVLDEGFGAKDDSREAFGFDSEDNKENDISDLGNTSDEDPGDGEDLPF